MPAPPVHCWIRSLCWVLTLALAGMAHAEVVIAIAGPATGDEAPRTEAILEGAKKAIAAANARGGVRGSPVRLITANDGCEAARAEAAARDLVEKHADLVLGHPCAAAAIAAAAVYGKAGTVFLAIGVRHPGLTRKRAGPTIFRLAGRDDKQGEEAARALARDFKGKTLAIIHDRTRYAKAIAEGAIHVLKAEKDPQPIVATIIAGDKAYAKTVAKVHAASAVLFAGYPIEAGVIAGELNATGSKAAFLASDSVPTAEFGATFGHHAAGMFALAPHIIPDALAAEAAVQVFEDSLEKASASQSTEGARPDSGKIAEMLVAGRHMTVLGPLGFDGGGDAQVPSFDFIQWNGTGWTPASGLGR